MASALGVLTHGADAGSWSTAAFSTAARLWHADGEVTTRHKAKVLTGDV
jgi:hypothetical protein